MNISIKSALKDISIVTITSIGGSIIWKMCEDIYNYQMYSIRNKNKHFLTEIKEMINFNFGTFVGFSLGISYIYTGQPFIYNLYKISSSI